MAKYRTGLPQSGRRLFLADGGIETTLHFHEGLPLPDFAAFPLLKTPGGRAALRKYFITYAEIASRFDAGVVLESPTWRASLDWASRLGYGRDELAEANRQAIRLLEEVRQAHDTDRTPVVVSGCVGPRGDGYVPQNAMSARQAEAYHLEQIETLADAGADMIGAITMNYVEEAVGIASAAARAGMPVAISFTVETDGNLPTGQSLQAAIECVDDATSGYPEYYMINCAHPTHFEHVLDGEGAWVERIRGVRPNASRKSHAELNEAADLDTGDPVELGLQVRRLTTQLPRLNIMGGCCGTDHRHVEQIALACSPLFQAAS